MNNNFYKSGFEVVPQTHFYLYGDPICALAHQGKSIISPIYDVVFKYLMEDSTVAKLLIESIIGAEVLELEFRPKSFTTTVHLDLKTRRRNELEILLSVLDQSNQTEDQHILNVREEDFPEQMY